MAKLNEGYWLKKRREREALDAPEPDYVACSGCGLRNHDTADPLWNCPNFPNCRTAWDW
jgi:hypothetical protein